MTDLEALLRRVAEQGEALKNLQEKVNRGNQ